MCLCSLAFVFPSTHHMSPPPSGAYSESGAVQCTPCGVGTIASASAAVMCSMCPVGQFANTTGQSVCLTCDAGFSSYEGGNACYPLNAPAPASVEAVVILKVNVDLSVAATPAFQRTFVTDIADVLEVKSSRIVINSVTAGSVLIDFTILPSTSGSSPWATTLASKLVALVAQPNSTLAQKIPVDPMFQPQVATKVAAGKCPLPQQGPDLSACNFAECVADFARQGRPCRPAALWCKPSCKCNQQACSCNQWYVHTILSESVSVVCVCVCVCV